MLLAHSSHEAIHPMSPTRSLRARVLKLGTLLVAVAGLGACIAPILTVPPPGATDISFASVVGEIDGGQKTTWTTHGGPIPQAALATYYVRNRALGEGVFTTAAADGSFTATGMEGTPNDQIQVYYVTPAGDYSDSVCLVLTEGPSPAPTCP
jgi:hypothetical protein